MSRVKVGYLLDKELKIAFQKKIISDSKFSSMSQAIDMLTSDFTSQYDFTKSNADAQKVFSGFEIDVRTKENINKIVLNSYEFCSATDFISRMIYEYVKDDSL